MNNMAQAIVKSMEAQANMLSAILKKYGLDYRLVEIRTKSEICDTCVDFIYVVKFDKRELYELFVKNLKGDNQ